MKYTPVVVVTCIVCMIAGVCVALIGADNDDPIVFILGLIIIAVIGSFLNKEWEEYQ